MNLPRIMLAAPKSGSGKTLITCALLQALKKRNINVGAFKTGPDYIDPMFHKNIIGVPSKNLDTFFLDYKSMAYIFSESAIKNEISVIEGAMGLYDGLGAIKQEASAYDVANAIKCPIILIIDAKGMGRSVIPLISGFLKYDTNNLIKGVILNKTNKMFCNVIKPEIEKETGVKVLGCFPVQKNINLESRHLGLIMPDEVKNLKENIKIAADELEKYVDINEIIKLAALNEQFISEEIKIKKLVGNIKIAVAKDEAFCFYYEDNLDVIKKAGAEICFFSPLRDKKLPENINGLILGGGYPELYINELCKNTDMIDGIKNAVLNGLPSLAECGGFMYLHKEIEDINGNVFKGVGVIDGKCFYTGKLVRFGYIDIVSNQNCLVPQNTEIKGHEFHYFDSTQNGDLFKAIKPTSQKSWECINGNENSLWGFPHLYYYSNPNLIYSFLQKAHDYKINN